MKCIYVLIVLSVLFISCNDNEKPKQWKYKESFTIDGVNPIGIANADGQLWLSDGDHNRLVQVDTKGKIIKTIDSLDRPMHLDAIGDTLYVPQYGNDKVEMYGEKGRIAIVLIDSLDAPAGIGVRNKEIAIADFYNNRILYNDAEKWISFGKEGNAKGYFYYPTDVQLTDSLIWVADAYNNRVQAFDKKGNFVKMIGQDQKMNAATGLFVSDDEVFVTDFENKRVLVFNHEGVLKQELKDGIIKATDLIVKDSVLYIVNYRSGELVLYDLQEKKE